MTTCEEDNTCAPLGERGGFVSTKYLLILCIIVVREDLGACKCNAHEASSYLSAAPCTRH